MAVNWKVKLVVFLSWTVTLQAFQVFAAIHQYPRTEEPTSEEIKCESLPPRTKLQAEPELDLLFLLTRGSEILQDLPNTGNATLILGNTGCGKTTIAQILAGDLSRLHAVINKGDQIVIIDDDNRIGLPSVKSKTLVPDLIFKTDNNSSVAFYDCPGFDDTRGTVQDIAANFFLNQVASRVTNIKMLFLVIYSSIKSGNEREDFDMLARHATKYVNNIEKFTESFGLIVTKVDYFNRKGELKEDHMILEEIVGFLEMYQFSLRSDLNFTDDSTNKEISKKIIFVKALLEKDPSTGNYTKIWFSRSPKDCGPLHKQKLVRWTKNNITRLHDNLKYTQVAAEVDFGFTLKDKSLLSIVNYTKVINENISDATNQVTGELIRKFYNLNVLPKLTRHDFHLLYNELRDISIGIDPIFNKLSQLKTIPEFIDELKVIWNEMKSFIPTTFEKFLSLQDKYLTFFEKVSGYPQERQVSRWSESIFKFQIEFNYQKDWYEFCLKLELFVSSYEFQYRRPVPPANFNDLKWFDYIVSLNTGIISDSIKKVYVSMGKTEINLLNAIMSNALRTPQTSCSSNPQTLTFNANYITTGEIKSHLEDCGKSITLIQVFATQKLFADKDLNLLDCDLVFVTPDFENPTRNSIVWRLEGSAALPSWNPAMVKILSFEEMNPFVIRGPFELYNRHGHQGNHGVAGKNGHAGGGIFGCVYNNVCSTETIILTSKGGDGGNGQPGENGGNGYSKDMEFGVSPQEEYPLSIPTPAGAGFYNRLVTVKKHAGFPGGNGGKGGNGGRKGTGGPFSQINMLTLDDIGSSRTLCPTSTIIRKVERGKDGNDGDGGIGGKGASAGQGYKCNDDVCYRQTYAPNGNPGSNGAKGGSDLGAEKPLSPRLIDEFQALLQFKLMFLNYSNHNTVDFIRQIDTSSATKTYFTLKNIAKELVALESLDKLSFSTERLADMYYLLIKKLEKYFPLHFDWSKEDRKIISILLTCSYSSYIRLRSPSSLQTILDVPTYFSLVKQQINVLRELQTLSAIQTGKQRFIKDLEVKVAQALNYIDTSVALAVHEAKVEIEKTVAAFEYQLSDLIYDTSRSLEDSKKELRRIEDNRNFLKIISAFEIIGKISSSFLPVDVISIASMSTKLSGQFSDNPIKQERLKELVREANRLIKHLKTKQAKFEEELLPIVDSLFSYWRNVSSILSNGGDISAPVLVITKWQVTSKLNDCKFFLEELADSVQSTKPLLHAFQRIQDAITLSFALYETVDRYLDTKNLAEYIATVYSTPLATVQIEDRELASVFLELENTVKQNLVEQEILSAMHAFKQWVFPFAKLYFPQGSYLGHDQQRSVEQLDLDLQKYNTLIVGGQDTFIIQIEFSSQIKTGKPFFVWSNENWKEEIHSLFSGSKVYLNADVRLHGLTGWEAIKFKRIEISFILKKASLEMQTEFDDILEYFGVSMTHSGVSYYRFQEDYFVMIADNQTLQYNFEVDADGNRQGTNQVYEKFKKGDYMLSPFTLWTVQLLNVVPANQTDKRKELRDNVNYESFKKFLPYVDVELVGTGTYVKGNEALAAAGGNLELEKWYEREDRLRY